jgi:hypothetical protein
MSRNINALVDTLKDRVSAVAGADLEPIERDVIVQLSHIGLELLRNLLLDINRCADASEVLAQQGAEKRR